MDEDYDNRPEVWNAFLELSRNGELVGTEDGFVSVNISDPDWEVNANALVFDLLVQESEAGSFINYIQPLSSNLRGVVAGSGTVVAHHYMNGRPITLTVIHGTPEEALLKVIPKSGGPYGLIVEEPDWGLVNRTAMTFGHDAGHMPYGHCTFNVVSE